MEDSEDAVLIPLPPSLTWHLGLAVSWPKSQLSSEALSLLFVSGF